ncbi:MULTISPECIES: hypothetical protein [unclassified Streptomyces]|uniref:hypothetical protein n=1 Tax=unclassified Streptomyces TaxID=2593676 RepID=UPI001EF0730E|nr:MULTISPECIES: hypothetical protein [unclassified Streptomyces]
MRPVEIADLISTEVQALLIKDVRHHWPHLTEDMGKRGVHQMVAFLATSTRTEQPLTPSLRVDAFWHAFLQRTVPYVAFSRALGVDLIHHVPQDDRPDPESGRLAMEAVSPHRPPGGTTGRLPPWMRRDAHDRHPCLRMGHLLAGDTTTPNGERQGRDNVVQLDPAS